MSERIPAGYLEDSQGRLVPVEKIRPEVVQADGLVKDLVGRALVVSGEMREVKRSFLEDIAAHVALVAERYQATITGKDGNVCLVSYDGLCKVERVTADRISIGEGILAAEQLIREIIDEIEDETARVIVDRAFRRHRKTGQLSAARLVDLVAVEIPDPRWQQAVRAIREAMHTAGSVTYFRAYRRASADGPWEFIPMDFSTVAPAVRMDANWPDGIERGVGDGHE